MLPTDETSAFGRWGTAKAESSERSWMRLSSLMKGVKVGMLDSKVRFNAVFATSITSSRQARSSDGYERSM